MLRPGFILGLLTVLSGLAGPAAAEERIISFASDIAIAADGELTVTETIQVRAEGDRIKRGIYRDFPTIYKEPGGGTHTVGFEVVDTLRDGEPVNHWTENQSNGVRVYMGDKDRYLARGSYVYRLTYKTDRQIRFFETFDELYWNVTGNGWVFPIDYAEATIHLPEGATVVRKAGYTGPQGDKGTAWSYGTDNRGNPVFATTSRLGPKEGLTVAVAFPKGFVTPPAPLDEVHYLLRDNLVHVLGIGGFGLLLIYYLGAWFHIGRDPPKGTVIPRWKAPRGISPAAARFVREMDFDKKALGAAVVSLAVKGHLTIEEDGRKKYRLKKRTAPVQGKMSPGEKAFKKALFKWGDVALVKAGNHERLKPAVDALNNALSANYEGAHFSHNMWVIFVGVFLTVGIIIATFFAGANAQDDRMAFLFIGMVGGGIGLNKLFTWLIKAPTMKGRRLMDEIEGFRMYLATAEQHRLNLLHPPERTPELFERYLPYAMALDVENEWGEQFKDVLAAAAAGGTGAYSPSWYHGRHWHSHDPGRFGSSVGSALGGATASAATPPSSS
jgi:hypothetical protein